MYKFINAREKVMKGIFLFSAVFSILALVTITVFLFASGLPFMTKTGFFEFLFGTTWAPTVDKPTYGILPMIVATLYVTALSVVLGVGIGLLTAIALYKFCPKKFVSPVRQMINLLAGIPSVIFGLFGMTIIVPFVSNYLSPTGVGYGIFSASLVLAVMILPTIVSVSLDALNAVPNSYYEGALALGATKEQATFKIMLPAAKSGIFAGVVLAIGRAIGETMAVIMVIGGSPEMPNSLFQSVRTLTSNIAMGALELKGDALSALIATGVVLFVFTLILNVSFALLKKKRKTKQKGVQKMKRFNNCATNNRRLFFALRILCTVALGISLLCLLAVVAYVLVNGVTKISGDLLFGDYSVTPSILPAIVGTLELVAISVIIAVPIGIASAIFLVEYTNNKGKLMRVVQVATETLAGIPSIVYGLFGYLIFVVAFGWGYSMLGGGITLAIMILPTIVRSTQESLIAVQGGLREGAYALGASKVRTIFKIVLPSAAGGIVTAIILAIGRVVSESAVLILTIGMVVKDIPASLMSPGTSLALDIYYFASHGYPDEAAATAVVLLVFVICLNLLAGLVGKLIKKSTGETK